MRRSGRTGRPPRTWGSAPPSRNRLEFSDYYEGSYLPVGAFCNRFGAGGFAESGALVWDEVSDDRSGARRSSDGGHGRTDAAIHFLYGVDGRRSLEDYRCRALVGKYLG